MNTTPITVPSVFDLIKKKLDGAGCAYTATHHDATTLSQVAFGIGDGSRALRAGAKAIVLKGKKTGTFYLFVIPEDLKIDQKKVKNIIGENISFASPHEVEKVTGCVVGSVPPFGSIIGLKTHADARMSENTEIFFNAGLLTDSIRMTYHNYIRVEKPEMVDVVI